MLVDAGAESPLHYVSDFTRTIPVGGQFTQQQLEIYPENEKKYFPKSGLFVFLLSHSVLARNSNLTQLQFSKYFLLDH